MSGVVLAAAILSMAATFVLGRSSVVGLVGSPVFPGLLTTAGFEPDAGGHYTSVPAPDRLHLLARNVSLAPPATVAVEFEVFRVPLGGISLHVDLFAPGFDPPESERRRRVTRAGTVRTWFPVSRVPGEVSLRLFYQGAPGLEISEPKIVRLPGWYARTAVVSWWAGLALGSLGLLGFVTNGRSAVWRWLSEEPFGRGAAGLLLLLVYAVSVVVRFLVYDATPYWSGDEYTYKGIAAAIWEFGDNRALREDHLGTAVDLPNPIYPFLIAPGFAWGESFYSGIRLVNASLMSLVVFPLYAIARTCVPRLWSLVFAMLVVCLPGMGLGAYATTETVFLPAFGLVALLSVRRLGRPPAFTRDVAVGLAIALAAGVRPTGVALLPAYLAAVLVCALVRGEVRDSLRRPTWLGAVLGFAIGAGFVQGFLRAPGDGGVGLYSGAVEAGGIDMWVEQLRADPLGPIRLVAGHVLTVSIPYAFFLAALTVAAVHLRALFVARPEELALVVVAITFFATMFAMTLAFTLYVSPTDLGGVDRWHARYYFVTFSLLPVAGSVAARRLGREPKRLRRTVAGVALAILTCGALVLAVTSVPEAVWFGSIVDNMDVQWMKYWPAFYALLALGMATATWLWMEGRSGALRTAGVTAVVWIGLSSAGVAAEARVGEALPPSACGRDLASLVVESEEPFAVFGRQRTEIIGLGFWLPRTPALSVPVSSGEELDGWLRRESVGLVLVNGDLPAPTGGRLVASSGECRAYAMARDAG